MELQDDLHATLKGMMEAINTGATESLVAQIKKIDEIGEALGVRFRIDLEKRIDGGVGVGDHKSSTLQDLEAGKRLELDAILGAVCEMGRLVGVETPAMDMINALTRQRATIAGCYPGD